MSDYVIYPYDCIDSMLHLMDEKSVHCVVTSPPYFGLRDYGTARWEGGDPACDHKNNRAGAGRADGKVDDRNQRSRDGVGSLGGDCKKCGARRIDDQIGLEQTPDDYVTKIVEVFRAVRRVLRDDGTVWLNLGDSYSRAPARGGSGPGGKNIAYSDSYGSAANIRSESAGSQNGRIRQGDRAPLRVRAPALSDKQLIGIPWRVAFALQADGWYLRQDIIWAKPNPMPESVRDRCTKSHEYIFLLTKSPRYYFDSDAIKEPSVTGDLRRPCGSPGANALDPRNAQGAGKPRTSHSFKRVGSKREVAHVGQNMGTHRPDRADVAYDGPLRNKRDVWTVSAKPFRGAHFATFPPGLIEPCVLAGSPAGGLVFDPFGGSGTTAMVALRHGRRAALCEINPEYIELAHKRIAGGK